MVSPTTLYKLPQLEVNEDCDKQEKTDIDLEGKKYWYQTMDKYLRNQRLKLPTKKSRKIRGQKQELSNKKEKTSKNYDPNF